MVYKQPKKSHFEMSPPPVLRFYRHIDKVTPNIILYHDQKLYSKDQSILKKIPAHNFGFGSALVRAIFSPIGYLP